MRLFSWLVIIAGFCGLGAVLFFGVDAIGYQYETMAKTTLDAVGTTYQNLTNRVQKSQEYSVVLVGDMMLDRGVQSRVYAQGNGDYAYLFKNIQSELQNADITFGNLEGSMSDVGADTGKAYSFRFEPASAQGLSGAGFDVVSLANNHILDWGRSSLCATVGHLADAGIFGVGAGCDNNRAEQAYIKELPNGTRVAFLAFTEFYKEGYARSDAAGLAQYTEENMIQKIKALKQEGVDLVFVSLHWGLEYHLRSNEAQQILGHTLIDAGADVIVGHHPHVIQEVERYKDGWIVYSLGNFIFDQKFSEQTMKGMIAKVVISDGVVSDIETTIIKLNENYQPAIDEDQTYTYISGSALEAAHVKSHQKQ